MPATTSRRRVLSFMEKLDLADFLKSVVETPENAPASYKTGWSDEAVAKRLECTAPNVRGVRHHLYPNFVDKHKRDTAKEPTIKVANLQAQIDHVCGRVTFMEEELFARLKYLEDALGVTPPAKPK